MAAVYNRTELTDLIKRYADVLRKSIQIDQIYLFGSYSTGKAEPQAPAQNKAPQEEKRSAVSEILWGTKKRQGLVETMAKQTARTMGSQVGRTIIRGILGGIFGGKK